MRRPFVAILLALATLAPLAPLSAAAPPSEASKPYVAPSAPLVSVQCTNCGAKDVNVGGALFPKVAGATPTQVTVRDVSGLPVFFGVCQDHDKDGLCGESSAGEPQVFACGGTLPLDARFRADADVKVFVTLAEPGCPGVASQGTIRVSYA